MQYVAVSLKLLRSPKRKFIILDNLSGVLPAGRMCLLLGPPGASTARCHRCSALHLADPAALRSALMGTLSHIQLLLQFLLLYA